MRLGVFARAGDPIASHLAALCERRGVDTAQFDLHAIADHEPLAFDADEWMIRGDVINDCDAYFVRNYPAPMAPVGDADHATTGAEWFARGLAQLERSHLAQSCLIDLERSTKPMMNPLLASGPFDLKPLQLGAFKQAGLRIPETVITNSPGVVRAFAKAVPRLIFKPTAGGAETRALDESAFERLDAIRAAPVIFQERIDGPDIRVTIVGGRIVSAVEIPTPHVDYRLSDDYRAGRQHYVEHALSTDASRMALTAASLCRHVLSGVDLKRTPAGEYVLIEANSSPVYLDIEQKTGHPITEAIIDWLCAAVSAA